MTKGEQTRNYIIQQAAELFNKRGYTGSSINDVMTYTGLQKGGIYRHFESKEQLALTAFDYAQRQSTALLEAAVASEADAIKRLLAFVETFREITLRPPVPGGCPIMNTIVDSDDGDPGLRAQVLAVVSRWQQLLEAAVAEGIAQGSIRADANPQAVAAVIIATLEGGILLSRAHRDTTYIQHAFDHVAQYVTRDLAA